VLDAQIDHRYTDGADARQAEGEDVVGRAVVRETHKDVLRIRVGDPEGAACSKACADVRVLHAALVRRDGGNHEHVMEAERRGIRHTRPCLRDERLRTEHACEEKEEGAHHFVLTVRVTMHRSART
jgi:hypothetical protein